MVALTLIRASIKPAAGGTSTATWDPANLAGAVILSNGNLTVFGDNIVDDIGASSTTSKSSGKYYFEFQIDAQYAGSGGNSIAVSTSRMAASVPLTRAGDLMWQTKNTYVYEGGVEAGFIGSIASSGRGHIAIDIDNLKGYFRVQGGTWNNASADPAGNSGGFDLSSGANYWITTDVPGAGQITAHFNASGWTGSAPSGFGEWT
jgi:hypothetical protein